jgi:predicted ATPase
VTDQRPIRAVGVFDDATIDDAIWPMTIPAVRAFVRAADTGGGEQGGWEFDAGVTFLVGENGSGKSTLVEGIATAVGLPAEGRSTSGGARTRTSESSLGS